jgi:hypothetical protein
MENSFLNLPLDDEVNLDGQLIAFARRVCQLSHRYGPQQGQKVFTLQTLPASNQENY